MTRQSDSTVLAWHQTKRGGEVIRNMVASSPKARLAGLEDTMEQLEQRALDISPDIIVVEMPGGINGSGPMLERLRRQIPRSALMVISDSENPDDILSALRLGAREYLTEPVEPGVFNEAVLRLMRQKDTLGTTQGRIISVMGVKGGVGASSVALNLAWIANREPGHKITLLDLDLFSGDLAWMLDLKPRQDLTQISQDFERLDASFLAGILTEVRPGLKLAAAPLDPIAAEDIKTEHTIRAVELLSDTQDLVIVDLPSRLDENSLVVLERSDRVLLILEPTVVSLRAARRLLSLGEGVWGDENKLSIVVNRDGAKGCLPHAEMERALGRKPLAYLPNDTRIVMEAANSGRPVLNENPRVKWSKVLKGLTYSLLEESAKENA